MIEINNNILSILKYGADNNKPPDKDSNNQQINKENKNKKISLNKKNKSISDTEEDESEYNTSNINDDNIKISKKKKNRTDNQKFTLTNKKKKIKSEIFNIEYEESDKKTYKYTFNKIHWNTLTTSYNCADYMCDARLSVSYEYKDNNRDSLKIKNINIKKDHSIDR